MTLRFPCHAWLNNRCKFSDLTCPFPHNKNGMPLCRYWIDGKCIGGVGNSCRYRHYYVESDGATSGPPSSQDYVESGPIEFSSPLVQRIERVTEKHHRVEIDLETGKRKSFIEETEQEIVDLTGNKENTPVKKRRVSMRIQQSQADDSSQLKPASAKEKQGADVTKKPASGDEGTCTACGRTFKGKRGLKSHLSSSSNKCSTAVQPATNSVLRAKQNTPKPPAATPVSRRPLRTSNANSSIIVID